MAASTLKRVMAERKRILKAHPNTSNSTALKQAWKKVKGSRVSGVKRKKKATPKRRRAVGTVKRKAPTRRKVGTVRRKTPRRKVSGTGIGAIKTTARAAEASLKDQLGRQYAAQYSAKTKTAKRKIAKQMRETKRKITSINKIINKK